MQTGVKRWWKIHLGVGTATGIIYLFLPTGVLADLTYTCTAVACVVAVFAGVRLHRPAHPQAWYLVGACFLLWLVGDILYAVVVTVIGYAGYPSPADAAYLLGYPLMAGGVLVMIRSRSTRPDAGRLLDSVILTTALALVLWVAIAGPMLSASQAALAHTVAVSYPVMDAVLGGMLALLMTSPGARTPAFRFLTAAVALQLGADVVYAVLTAHSSYDAGPIDLLWMASYVFWGCAALHPTMTTLTNPAEGPHRVMTWQRLLALTLAVLIAPLTLGVQAVADQVSDVWPVVVASVVLFGLVMARMALIIQEIIASTAQRDELARHLAHEASHDQLTALANRGRALERIEDALGRSSRTGAMVGLLYVDLDNFKTVNDTFGHESGDAVLRHCAAQLRSRVRAGDTVGRLGGDEFVVLVESIASESALVDLAERLVRALGEPIPVGRRQMSVGASIGIAISRGGTTDASTLLNEADIAVYRAKSAGRGRAELFDSSLRAQLEQRGRVEEALRHAIEQDELLLYYQPVVEVGSGAVCGYEALVRWMRPDHGLTMPDEFIPIAEQTTLINDLGRWVLHEATRQLASWRAADPAASDLTVSVNISGRHLASGSIVRDVVDALADSGLPANCLVVEITETVLVDEPVATARLRSLRTLGVGVSVDDFGTGYTSIGQLQHLPATTLKIDKSLMSPSAVGGDELLRLVIHAAHAFGLNVVAEGVEREVQLPCLREAGCDQAQGYLFAYPRPASAIAVGRNCTGAPQACGSAHDTLA